MKNINKILTYSLCLTASLVLFLSCSNEPRMIKVCNCEEKNEVKKWVGDHIKDANNMSDEEMEDVIYRLEKTAVKIISHDEIFYCKSGTYVVDWADDRNKLDKCETV